MVENKRATQQWLQRVQIESGRPFDRVLVPVLLLLGVTYAAWQFLTGDWLELALFAFNVFALLSLAVSRPLQTRILGGPFTRLHAAYIVFFWVYSAIWLNLARLLPTAEPTGKNSAYFYALLIGLIVLTIMLVRAVALLTPFGRRVLITDIPFWEQLLVALNELIAAGLLTLFVSNVIVRVFQPNTFTTRFDVFYNAVLGAVVVLYYGGMQLMWLRGWNDLLSKNIIWVRLARLLAPLALVTTGLVIARRYVQGADPRTANLIGDADTNLAVLALAPVVFLVILVVAVLVYTGRRGLRQRFLPDDLLDRLPPRLARGLRSISDMDMLLLLALLATSIPVYLLLLGDTGGVIGLLRQQILQRGSALIETSEQALALLFAMPFYALIVLLLALYGFVISRASLSALEREDLVRQLPIGFLIILIITLYLFAVPFSQVLTERRLPQLPQDLGRILAFNVLVPLFLLYAHYITLVRTPYGRGQKAWRAQQGGQLARQLDTIDRRIENLNRELEQLERAWQFSRTSDGDTARQMDTLYRFVQLNSQRDDLNMQRLRLVSDRQALAELSDAPLSLAVARLPLRVVSLGIPLLLAIQLYQWAVVNNGLRSIIDTPNLSVVDFFREVLRQLQF